MSTLTTTAGEPEDESEDSGIPKEITAQWDAETALAKQEKRGTWHILANFKAKQPLKCKFVCWLLGKGASIREVAELAEVSNTTVCQIIHDPELGPPIAEQKSHITKTTKMALRVGLELKLADWLKSDAKAPDVFDLKLLSDMVALADGGATQRVEHIHTIMNPETSATLRLLEASVVTVDGQKVSTALPVQEAEVMGSDGQKVHALPAPTDQPQPPDAIRESEGKVPNSGADV